jgi:hypothetical protein
MLRLRPLVSSRTRGPLIACVLAAIAALGTAIAPVGCSSQGEGERCNVLSDSNGNEDCQQPELVCTPAGQLNGNDHSTDRCCPPDRSQATTFVCQAQSAGGIDAAAPPVDAGDGGAGDVNVEGGNPDATPDGETDGGPDASTDSPADAPQDG